uniref:Putative product n=1 Tax=Xenopsylla cheopis TaxID=163159 RepID=A0A6M2DZW7_XENCH
MQHPWRIPLAISTLLVSPWSSLTLTIWFMYKFPISLRSLQSTPIVLSNSISLPQLILYNAFFHSMKHAQMSSFTSRHLSDITLSISIASPVLLSFLNPLN